MTALLRSILGRREPDAQSDPARTVERLAALLGAGVSASTCWRLLSEDTPGDPVLRAAAEAAARGEPVADAISDSLPRVPRSARAAWAATAAGVAVASQAGAPMSDALRVVSERLASVAETGRETEIALAGPRMTTRLVLALPVLGILGSSVLGFDAWAALIGTPYGRIVGAAGRPAADPRSAVVAGTDPSGAAIRGGAGLLARAAGHRRPRRWSPGRGATDGPSGMRSARGSHR